MSSLFTNNDKPEFIKSFMVIFSILTLIQISITFLSLRLYETLLLQHCVVIHL